jgi:hypothetical protein
MSAEALLSSARQDWRTPEWFLELVQAVGPIALDPASAPDNPTRARTWIVQGGLSCGLRSSWARDGLAFVNPPYGKHLSGPVDPDRTILRKGEVIGRGTGWAERIASDLGEWIALVPTRTDAAWWHTMHAACTWAVLWRSPAHGSRIQFVDPDTGAVRSGSTLASSVFYHGPNPLRFLEIFGPHGRTIPGQGEILRLLNK